MKAQRVPFGPLTEDLDDKIESLARKKGVGALVKPGPQSEQGALSAPVRVPAEPASKTEPAPRTPMKTVNMELPDYLWTALKIRAVEKQTSVRHVIMTALQRDAFAIAESDMIDASRRMRGITSPG